MHAITVFRLTIAIFVLFAFSSAAKAQAVGSWDNLSVLSSGTRVMVEQDGGRAIKGRLSRVSTASIILTRDGKEIEIRRDLVAAIFLTRKSSRVKRAVIGGLAGAGAGLLIGAATVAATKGDPLIAAGGFLYGLPAGAAIGAATGGIKKGELIYRR